MDATFRAPRGLGGVYAPPADKSITHRALMLAAVASGASLIRRPLATGDCVSTRQCMEALGAGFEMDGSGLAVRGVGLRGLREPSRPLDAENSGTTMRLLSGLIAGQSFYAVLTGDGSLLGRPMGRVVEPLRAMGARIEGRAGGKLAPLSFLPGTGSLSPAAWKLPMPSAQVKSSILLAALRATGTSRVEGMTGSRDHTERMLSALGVPLRVADARIEIDPVEKIPGFHVDVPGDISSAAFFMAAALLSGRALTVESCGTNPTRCGFLSVARRMGAEATVVEQGTQLGDPAGTITVTPGTLVGTRVDPGEVPELIDEVPLIAVLGLFARGRTVVRGAEELRFKESDRLTMIAQLAESLGGRIDLHDDGFSIEGPQALRPGTVDPRGDHRIAMAAAVAAAGIPGGVTVRGFECARVSYPDFVVDFTALGGEAE
jgi:3-phosphoshikimate 1-carboxyvinyltransferase